MFSLESIGAWKISQQEVSAIEFYMKNDMLTKGYSTVYPAPENVFKAFELTQPENVRVVILGQDPYPQMCTCGRHPRAQGFSFSVADCDSIPSSLNNIFKEIHRNYPETALPENGNLESWADQGVLLLNTSLTVQPGKPNSHESIWMGVIKSIIAQIDSIRPKTIYCLWGRQAEFFEQYLPNSAIKLKTSHPSGLSAYKGFMGCGHFGEINRLLLGMGDSEIVWF